MTHQEAALLRADLEALQRLLAAFLLQALQSPNKPSAEHLGIARSLLKDCGLLGAPADAQDGARLEFLYSSYVEQLSHAVLHSPSSSILSEARLFLAAQGMNKDLGGAMDARRALAELTAADLPFKTQ